MERLVFLGPTLTADRATTIAPDVRILPPAQHGDVLDAVHRYAPGAIGLVDGYFRQHASVWHKELLWAMAQGVRVYGAASMGALRAAELARYGMIGVGTVYDAFRRGALPPFDGLTDDDAVAVSHGPAETGYLAVSDARVDIEATLRCAVVAGILSDALARRLSDRTRALPFGERRYATLVEQERGRLDADKPASRDADLESLDKLVAWLPAHRVSIKREDAERLLALLQHAEADTPTASPGSAFVFERTEAFADAEAASAVRRRERALSVREQDALERLRADTSVTRRIGRLARSLRQMEATGLAPDRQALHATARRFRDRHRLFDRAAVLQWLEVHDLDAPDFDRLMARAWQLERASDGFDGVSDCPDRMLLDVARLTGVYPRTTNDED